MGWCMKGVCCGERFKMDRKYYAERRLRKRDGIVDGMCVCVGPVSRRDDGNAEYVV